MNVVVHMTECRPGSTVASARVARFISEVIPFELVDTKEKAIQFTKHGGPIEYLIIVNGPMAFCDFLPELGELVYCAKRVIWVQQDYTIKPPSAHSKAESPFRKAFADRQLRPSYWTTVQSNVEEEGDYYINWNQLTYEPTGWSAHTEDNVLLYYGAFREKRLNSFYRFFNTGAYRVKISTTPIRGKKFLKACNGYGNIDLVYPFNSLANIPRCKASLYIEDDKSHSEFHSPANRFYELLSVGIPILFDSRALPMLHRAGIKPHKEWVVSDANDVLYAFRNYDMKSIALSQHEMWHDTYKENLQKALLCIWRATQNMG